MLKSYLNSDVLIRLWALFSRFLLIGLAAIELTAGDFGQWSLIITAITLLSYIIGLDLYVPAVRALYEAKVRAEANATVWSLALVYGLNFIMVSAALLGFQQLKIYAVGNTSLFLVLPLLLFEHLSAEANRQLNLLGRHKQANSVLLIRSSLPIVIFGLFCIAGENNLINLLISQIFGTGVALLPACYYFKNYISLQFTHLNSSRALDESSVRRLIPGKVNMLLKGCGVVFLTTCLLKGSQALDRQFLATLADLPRVGAYALTMTATNAISSAIDAMLVSTSISKLLDAKKIDDRNLQITLHYQLRRRLLYLSCVLHLVTMAAFLIVEKFFNQNKYDFSLTEITLLLSASFFLNYSLADSALLFSLKKDKISLWAALIGIAVLFCTIFMLKDLVGANAVAYGVFASALCTWLARKIPTNYILSNLHRNL